MADERASIVFPPEAILKWKEYVQNAFQYAGSSDTEFIDVINNTSRKTSTNFRMYGPWSVISSKSGSKLRTAIGVNSFYNFKIQELKQDEWIIKNIQSLIPEQKKAQIDFDDVDPKTPWLPPHDLRHHESSFMMTCRGLYFWGNWFPAMIQSKGFIVESVTEEMYKGELLVRVQFLYNPVSHDNNPISNGYVLLDPNHYWLIRYAKTKSVWPDSDSDANEINITNEFDTSLNGFPLPKYHRKESIGETPEVKVHVFSEINYAPWKLAPINEKEYILSAFGIPEPTLFNENDKTTRLSFLILILGNLIALLLFLGWYLFIGKKKLDENDKKLE